MQECTSGDTLRRFGRYQLLEVLGSGGMADVYRARLEGAGGFHKTVALKVFHEHLSEDPVFAPTFISEARLGGYLDHPNIVATLDFGRHAGRLFMAMEYVRGLTMQQILATYRKQHRYPPLEVVLDVCRQFCHALEYAHNAVNHEGNPLKIVHRDLKPSNLLIDLLGTAKIADFGVARAESNVVQTLVPGTLKGTIRYMSPEQALGRADLDHRSDIFALGLVLFESISLEPCYDGTTLEQVLCQAQEARVGPRFERIPPVPCRKTVVSVLERALATDPDRRFRSCAELAASMERILERLQPEVDTAIWTRALFARHEGTARESSRRKQRFEAATRVLASRHSQAPRAGSSGQTAAPAHGEPTLPGAAETRLEPSMEEWQPTLLAPEPIGETRSDLPLDDTVRRETGHDRTVVSREPISRRMRRAEETVARPYFANLSYETRVSEPWTADKTAGAHSAPPESSTGLTPTAHRADVPGASAPPAHPSQAAPIEPNRRNRRLPFAGRGGRCALEPTVVLGAERPPRSHRSDAAHAGERDRRRWPGPLVALLGTMLIGYGLRWWPDSTREGNEAPLTVPVATVGAKTGPLPATPPPPRASAHRGGEPSPATPAGDSPGRSVQPALAAPRAPRGDGGNRAHDENAGGSSTPRVASKPRASTRTPDAGIDTHRRAPEPVQEPATGRLFLYARPPAELIVDGRPTNQFPVQDLPVAPGEHTIAFGWGNGDLLEHVVEVGTGQTVRCVAEQQGHQVRCRTF